MSANAVHDASTADRAPAKGGAGSGSSTASDASTSRPPFFMRVSHAVEGQLIRWFEALGGLLARRPKTVMLVSFLIAIAFSAGMANFRSEGRPNKLWVPQGSEALENQEVVEDLFGQGDARSTVIGVSDGNALTLEMFENLFELDAKIVAIEEDEYAWATACRSLDGGRSCLVTGALEFVNRNRTLFDSLASNAELLSLINEPGRQTAFQTPLEASINDAFGGIEYADDGSVASARAVKNVYWLVRQLEPIDDGQDETDFRAEALELELVELARAQDGDTFTALTEAAISEEFSGAIGGDLTLLFIGIALIVIYVVSMIGEYNIIDSRMLVGLSAVLTVALSIVMGYGFCSLLGFPFTPVHNVLPFLLIGIAVDDAFIITSALASTDRTMSIEDRMRSALGHAGPAITITSLTDFLAFAIGATTRLPALQAFAIYAAFCILFDFFLQVTLFSAILVLDTRRQYALRPDCCPCCVLTKRERIVRPKETPLRRFVRTKVAVGLTGPLFGGLVLLAGLGFLAAAIAGVAQLEQEFLFTSFIPDDSPLQEHLARETDYFTRIERTKVSVYVPEFDWDERDGLTAIADVFGSNEFIETEVSTFYAAFAPTTSASDEATWTAELIAWTESTETGRGFQSDLVFNDDSTRLVACRMSAFFRFLDDSQEQVDAMVSLREDINDNCDGCAMDAFAYTFEFTDWEANRIIVPEAVQNLSLALAAVALVVLVLIGHPGVALMVTLAVAVTIVEMLGFAHWWGIKIDSVLVIDATLAIGLSVDAVAHVSHAFLNLHGTRQERVVKALTVTGIPVLNGVTSTGLAVFMLAFSESYIFRVFFKVLFLTLLFGAFNGILLMPVLLNYIGPLPEHREEGDLDREYLNSISNAPEKTAGLEMASPANEESV